MNEKINAVIYARFSSHNQQEQSVDGQVRYCTQYAEAHNMRIIGTYVDRAMSGTNDNRPDFQKMIKDSENKQFQVVLVWKFDRFARNRYDSAFYRRALKNNGVAVTSATESVGEGSEAIILEAILDAMADAYSKQLAENVKRGMRESALKCQTIGGCTPLGYDVVNKMYIVNEEEAEIVKYIYREYADGKGKKEIITELNNRGYKTKRGKKFTITSLSQLLKNKRYIGIYGYKNMEIKDGIPAIIDEDLFCKAQQVALKNKRDASRKKAKVEYLLSGKLYCGHCGEAMLGESAVNHSGYRYYYYVCGNRKKRLRTCDKKRERKEGIEEYCVRQALGFFSDKQNLQLIAKKVVDLYNSELDNGQVEILEQNKIKLEKQLDELTNALVKTTNARVLDKLNCQINTIDEQLSTIDIEIAREKSLATAKMSVNDVVEFVESLIQGGDIKDNKFKKQIINVLINRIYLYDDKIVIYFNGSNSANTVDYTTVCKDLEKFEEEQKVRMLNAMPCHNAQHTNYIISDAACVFAMIARR